MQSQSRTKRIALIGVLLALAFILSYLDSLIPIAGIPGFKLGLANIAILVMLYTFGGGMAAALSVVRILLVSFTFGNLAALAYSAAGAALSLLVMAVLKKTGKFSTVGVSLAGAAAHNLGQIIVAVLVLGKAILYYFPVLLVTSVVTGAVIGFLGGAVCKRLENYR